MGPTASGKSTLAESLFSYQDFELISVDSAQVYRGMNIGTAKPEQNLMDQYPHHLIDIRDFRDSFSAGDFRNSALSLIQAITARNKIPMLAGGTMFYFSVLEQGISCLPASDPDIRRQIEWEFMEKGNQHFYQFLTEIDSVAATLIRSTDTQRLQRMIELYRLTGRPPSAVMAQSRPKRPAVNFIKIALSCARTTLHQRIALRFQKMLEQGLIDEVRGLVSGLEAPEKLLSMRSVGYRQVLEYLQGKITKVELEQKGVAATRQLAKRQLTWLRNQAGLVWLDSELSDPTSTATAYLSAHPIFHKLCNEM